MAAEEAIHDDELILGTFIVNDMPARVRFEAIASRSFVSPVLCA